MHRLVLIDLDLDATSWGKLRNNDAVGNLLEDSRIGLATETIVERMQICGSNNVLQVGGLCVI